MRPANHVPSRRGPSRAASHEPVDARVNAVFRQPRRPSDDRHSPQPDRRDASESRVKLLVWVERLFVYVVVPLVVGATVFIAILAALEMAQVHVSFG
jgi:hypothetical protein